VHFYPVERENDAQVGRPFLRERCKPGERDAKLAHQH